MTTTALPSAAHPGQKTAFAVIFAVAFCHLINDVMQYLLAAIYPLLKADYGLDFVQIGLLSFTFQVTASLLQPVIGIYTDKRPLPYSLPVAAACSAVGLIILGLAQDYWLLLVGSAFIGLGSAIFHPESSRVARLASGGRHGLAQSTFQVGGNIGSALGPILAAFVVLPRGQASVAWFAIISIVGMAVLSWVGRWYAAHLRDASKRPPANTALPFDKRTTVIALLVLVMLTLSKHTYMAGLGNYFTFYTMDKFGVDVQMSQLLLFVFLGASALGAFIGGPIGDRFGAKFVIWFSILGAVPFALVLPYADFTWTVVLVLVIGVVLSSAFSAIVVFAQELMPGRIGMIAGIFFGFAFGMAGIAAALLGALADSHGLDFVFRVTSYLPLFGLLTVFLPEMKRRG
ncbi:MAG: MFS transporter [Hyphomicrobiales bacterium]|nr:MAG: MFS transporter [Hyphomicrobiales bacterium]